ncbi:MAG: methyltransferase domain-containing protein [Minisyncoccia bacterium]
MKDNSVDGVIAVNIFNTVMFEQETEAKDAIKEIHRVLKENGCFIQSNYGSTGGNISEKKFKDILDSFFKDIKFIHNDNINYLNSHDAVAFIARKK